MLEKRLARGCCVFFVLSFRFVSPYPSEASAGRPVFSVLLFFCQSSFSCTFSSPSSSSSPSFCPLPSRVFHQRRVRLMVDGGIAALQTHPSFHYLLLFNSFLCFLLSLVTLVGRSIFLLPGSSDTERRGEDKEGWRERLREREQKKGGKRASVGRWNCKQGMMTERGRWNW